MALIAEASEAVDRSDYAGAVGRLHQAIAIYQHLGMRDEEAAAWMTLAAMYMLIGGGDNATVALDRSRDLAKRSRSPDAVRIIDAIQHIRELMARDAPADELMRANEELCRLMQTRCSDGGPVDVPKAHRAIRLMNAGQYEEGRRLLHEVLAGTTSHDMRAVFYAGIAGSYVYQRNVNPAIEAYKRVVQELELASETLGGDAILPDYFDGFEAVRKQSAETLVELLAGQGRLDEALSYAERARSRAFLQMIGNRRINPRDEQLAAEVESLRATASSRTRADLVKARMRYRELLTRVKAADPEYASLVRIEPLDIDAMQRRIPPGTTVVVYFMNTTTLHAWLVEHQRLQYLRLDAIPADVARAVCWARSLVRRPAVPRSMESLGGECDDPMTAEEAHAALIGPLLPYIHDKRLVIVPHGPLHYIPFAALRNPRTHRYLIEDYVLTYAPSLSVLDFLRRKESPVDGDALIIGDPANGNARPLPGARSEATAIAGMFGTKAYTGSDATESLLYHAARKYDLIHIGAHAEYDAANPLFTRLMLAPGDERDGSLEVHEILADVDLTGVNLVVLSACTSGGGKPTGGDEIVSLTRAIHYAGSPGVISTLWEIEDEAAAAFMSEFYGRLRAGAAAVDAVRGAQLVLLRRPAFHDPAYWAAFTLSGDPEGRWQPRMPH